MRRYRRGKMEKASAAKGRQEQITLCTLWLTQRRQRACSAPMHVTGLQQSLEQLVTAVLMK